MRVGPTREVTQPDTNQNVKKMDCTHYLNNRKSKEISYKDAEFIKIRLPSPFHVILTAIPAQESNGLLAQVGAHVYIQTPQQVIAADCLLGCASCYQFCQRLMAFSSPALSEVDIQHTV